MQIIGNLLFSIVLTFSGFSTFIINDSWPEIALEKQITRYSITIPFEKESESYADKFHLLKDLLVKSYGINDIRAGKFADWVLISTQKSTITPETMAALIMTESSFRYNIKSHAGAVGPAQVIPYFWENSCYGDLENDPHMNIKCGVFVLEHYKKRCDNNLQCAFEMYNVGPTNFYKDEYSEARERYFTKITNYKNQILASKDG